MEKKATHFAVYYAPGHVLNSNPVRKRHYFEFHFGKNFAKKLGSSFELVDQNPERIKTIPIPPSYRKEIQKNVESMLGYTSQAPTGHLQYTMHRDGTTAISTMVEPKKVLRHSGFQVKKLGYLLEYFAAKHLKTLGVTHVMTPDDSSPDRMDSLEAVGINPYVKTPIDEWIKAMLKGIQAKMKGEKLRDKAAKRIVL